MQFPNEHELKALRDLMSWNDITDRNLIYVGQEIKVYE